MRIMHLSIFCPTPPPYRTRLGLVGDLINESYHVLFINNIHCFNAQINEIILESLKLLQNENTICYWSYNLITSTQHSRILGV